MNTAIKRAHTLAGDALQQAAMAGVARAKASRQTAGVELTGADVNQVSGGLMLSPVIRCGGFPVDPGLVTGPAINPVLPAAPAPTVLQNAGTVV